MSELDDLHKTRKFAPLSGKMWKTLKCLDDYTKKHEYPPLYSEMCLLLGLASKNTVFYRINKLEDLGLIERRPGSPRSVILTDRGRSVLHE